MPDLTPKELAEALRRAEFMLTCTPPPDDLVARALLAEHADARRWRAVAPNVDTGDGQDHDWPWDALWFYVGLLLLIAVIIYTGVGPR